MSDEDRARPGGALSPQEREAFRARASRLGEKLDAARGQTAARAGPPGRGDSGEQGRATARALRISAELLGGVVVGGGLGWVLDRWLGTHPAFFIVMFLLGAAAGIANIVRLAMRERTPPAPSVKDVEDAD